MIQEQSETKPESSCDIITQEHQREFGNIEKPQQQRKKQQNMSKKQKKTKKSKKNKTTEQ